MFCAIMSTIERCKTEGVVDVFQVTKALRVQKPGAVLNVVHTLILCCNLHNNCYNIIIVPCLNIVFHFTGAVSLCVQCCVDVPGFI